MPKSIVWLSYDLGVDGPYEELYHWLDERDAKECGDSVAVLLFSWTSDIKGELKRSLKNNVNLRARDRIYAVVPREKSGYRGAFVFGNRKAAPWAGTAGKLDSVDDT